MSPVSCAKSFLVWINSLAVLLGLGVGISGLVFRFGTDFFDDEIKEALKKLNVEVVGGVNIYEIATSLSLLLIIVGFFVFIVGALGCCGACCSNRVLLVLYAIIVSLLLIVQITSVPLFAAFRGSIDDLFKSAFKTVLNDTYSPGGDADVKRSFDELFKRFKCCGVDGPSDIPGTLPDGCCKVLANPNTCARNPADNIRSGCYQRLEDEIEQYSKVFIGVGIPVLVFQIVMFTLGISVLLVLLALGILRGYAGTICLRHFALKLDHILCHMVTK